MDFISRLLLVFALTSPCWVHLVSFLQLFFSICAKNKEKEEDPQPRCGWGATKCRSFAKHL